MKRFIVIDHTPVDTYVFEVLTDDPEKWAREKYPKATYVSVNVRSITVYR